MAAWRKPISQPALLTAELCAIVYMQGAAAESMGDDLGRVLERSLKWQHAGPGNLDSPVQHVGNSEPGFVIMTSPR